MVMYKRLSIIIFACISLSNTWGQERLSLEEAIDKALLQNHIIQIAELTETIHKNNAHPGAAGLLPIIQLSGNTNYTIGNATIDYSQILPVQGENSTRSSTLTNDLGLGLSYKIFDGMKNVYTFRKLKDIAGKSELETRENIEQTIIQVISVYLQAAQSYAVIKLANENIQLSLKKTRSTKDKYDFGESKLPYLNSLVNLNNDSLFYIDATNMHEKQLRDLNLLLGEDISTKYELDTDIAVNETLILEDLISKALDNNVSYKIADFNIKIAEKDEKIAKSGILPTLTGRGGYAMYHSSNDIGLSAKIAGFGFSGSLSLSLPIFDGNIARKQQQNAQIAINSASINKEFVQLTLEHDITNIYGDYLNSLRVLEFQNTNLEIAQQNYSRSETAHQSGLLNGLSLRDAQLNLLNIQNLIENAKFTAKLLEYQLMHVSGQLLQDGEE